MTKKLLSVIIPVYNAQDYIIECVDSVLRQASHSYEIIIVNDGSTDKTLTLVRGLYGKFTNVKIVTIPHEGLVNARNTGIQNAEGQFILCCDANGVVCDGLFKELEEIVTRYPKVDLFCFNSLMFKSDNPGEKYTKLKHEKFGIMSSEDAFVSLLHSGSGALATSCQVIRKSAIDAGKPKYVQSLHDDLSFTLEAFIRARCAFISKHFYYNQRIPSTILATREKNDGFIRQNYEAFILSYERLMFLTSVDGKNEEMRRLFLLHSFKLMIYLCLNDNRKIPGYILNAIRYFGKDLKSGSAVNWLVLYKPETYLSLIKLKKNVRTVKSVG